jgi:ferredoxin
VLGSLSAGPIYAAFPIGKSLLSKGASIANIVIILSSWAVIKVPMLANEAKFLGIDFMIVRWILTVISILIMGSLTAVIVKKKDLPNVTSKNQSDILIINEEYCIGCGLCNKMMPEFYEMKNDKAKVIASPKNKAASKAILETVEKCPTKAIVFKETIKEAV